MSPTQNQKTYTLAFLLLAVSAVQAKRGTWIPINLPLPAPAPTAATASTASTPSTASTASTPATCVISMGCGAATGCTVGETMPGMNDGTCDTAMQTTMCYLPGTCTMPVAPTVDCACAN